MSYLANKILALSLSFVDMVELTDKIGQQNHCSMSVGANFIVDNFL